MVDVDLSAWETLCLAYNRMREAGAAIKRQGMGHDCHSRKTALEDGRWG